MGALRNRLKRLEAQLEPRDVAREPDSFAGLDLSALTLERLKWLLAPYDEIGAMREMERVSVARELPHVREEFVRRVNEVVREEQHGQG